MPTELHPFLEERYHPLRGGEIGTKSVHTPWSRRQIGTQSVHTPSFVRQKGDEHSTSTYLEAEVRKVRRHTLVKHKMIDIKCFISIHTCR